MRQLEDTTVFKAKDLNFYDEGDLGALVLQLYPLACVYLDKANQAPPYYLKADLENIGQKVVEFFREKEASDA